MPTTDLPETVLQFGAGNFLRAFADLFIHEANERGQAVGRVVVVQSTDSGRAAALNRNGSAYHVLVRGRRGGAVVDEAVRVTSVSRAVSARDAWPDVLAVAGSADLKLILSNTTEAGLALDESDRATPPVPASFPAKLVNVLQRRFEFGLPGVTVMPCELVGENGRVLRDLCLEQAHRWALPAAFVEYLRSANVWLNSLVDRIVSGRPSDHSLLATDPLLTAVEPFALWAVESPVSSTVDARVVPFSHPALTVVADVKPYALRKIRILNGAHSALVCKALPMGLTTVRQAAEHPEVGPWLRDVLFEEIVPVLEGRVDDPRGFAEQTLERFANPFLEHKLADIALNHEAKVRTRLSPTIAEFADRFGRPPARLAAAVQG